MVETRISCWSMASSDIVDASCWCPSASHMCCRSYMMWVISASPIRAFQICAVLSDDTRQNRCLDLHCLYWELRHPAHKHIVIYISEPGTESHPHGVREMDTVFTSTVWGIGYLSRQSGHSMNARVLFEVAFALNSVDIVQDTLIGLVNSAQVLTQR